MEKNYNIDYENIYKGRLVELGMIASFDYLHDPKHLLFMMSRYKFVSKMLQGFHDVLEVGCGDGFASAMIKKEVVNLDAVDIDSQFINNARSNPYSNEINFKIKNVITEKSEKKYNAIYSLDVLEHIDIEEEDDFMKFISNSLIDDGVSIIGIPSKESQVYASNLSKKGHINCKTGLELKVCMSKYFKTVFIFSMNDEVVHTGFNPMAHYLFALCINPKN